MNPELARSYAYCVHVAKTHARNFYFSFVTLPPERRAAMCAVYAFFRYSDDVSDEAIEDASKAGELQRWRQALSRALDGDYGDSLILPAFHDTVRRYAIPPCYFHALIDGTEMDLCRKRYASFSDLRGYCYHVATVVGIVCLHVWGFDADEGRALEYADACGIAFQLTNILRDVGEDIARDRIYLPREDMDRFGVTEADLRTGRVTEELRALMRFQIARAREYYAIAWRLVPLVSREGRATLIIMLRIYSGILDSIERNKYDVFRRRARVSTPKKLAIIVGGNRTAKQHAASDKRGS